MSPRQLDTYNVQMYYTPEKNGTADDIKIEKVLVGVDKYCPPKPVVKFTVKKEETKIRCCKTAKEIKVSKFQSFTTDF